MEENYEQEYRVVFWELVSAIRKKISLIFGMTLMMIIVSWGISSFLITPRYEASVNMIVNTKMDSTGNITNDNISSAQNLVDTYAIIVKSNTVLNQVIEQLNLHLTYEEIYDQVSISAINNTQVMEIAAQNNDPEIAEKIVETISILVPDVVAEAVDGASCKTVSLVKVDEEPIFPNVKKIVVMTGFLSFMLCIAVIVLKELLNDYITDDSELEKKVGVPVLGIIPEVRRKIK